MKITALGVSEKVIGLSLFLDHLLYNCIIIAITLYPLEMYIKDLKHIVCVK